MKNRNFTNIIIEGTDGVGKSTLQKKLLEYYNYRIPVYDRGELSNMVYAKKYDRPFSAMQRHLPILYIFLYCNATQLGLRIQKRATEENWPEKELRAELEKISDQGEFFKLLPAFAKDYHLITLDTTALNADEVLQEAVSLIDSYSKKLKEDDPATYTAWNILYKMGCDHFGLDFKVINNQPYINNIAVMGEINNQNGVYETFSDKRYPHNLIYMFGYNQHPEIVPFNERKVDFTYIINSKILSRHEVYDYMENFIENNLSMFAGKPMYMIDHPLVITMERPVGDPLIKKMSEAKATVYMARKMAYLKYVSVRLYESILAENVIFVDKLSDPDCEILKAIYGDNEELINLLYVDENSICENYETVINDEKLVKFIIKKQHQYYDKLVNDLEKRFGNKTK